MAKGNNSKGKDFFSQSKKLYGEEFLNYMNARDLQFKATQVFRQLARGQVDVIENGKYFLQPQFLEACIVAANSKYTLHSISRDGVQMLINSLIAQNMKVSNDMNSVFDFHTRATEAYGCILNTLNIINTMGNTDSLIPLVQSLSNYRNYI